MTDNEIYKKELEHAKIVRDYMEQYEQQTGKTLTVLDESGTITPKQIEKGTKLVNDFKDYLKKEYEPHTILHEAQSIVYGKREENYGHPLDNFDLTAKLIEPIVGKLLTAEEVALLMIQLKVARQLHKPNRDNLVDIAGYAATIERCEVERKNREVK